MSEQRGSGFLAAIEANKLTIDELQAVVTALGRVDQQDLLLAIAVEKMRWRIAASRNEVDYG